VTHDPPPIDAGLFGTDYDPDQDRVVVIGVPWEPTASYGRGTSQTPARLVTASHQLDFYVPHLGRSFGERVGMLPPNDAWLAANRRCLALAEPIHRAAGELDATLRTDLDEVNRASRELEQALYETTRQLHRRGKRTGVLGGDHASPLGHMRACLERAPGASVLHIDAHHDLRIGYEGFTQSHASIMYNLLNAVPDLGALVSVGIRDYCEEERRFAETHPAVTTHYDRDLSRALSRGVSWHALTDKILAGLGDRVYISFDVDGLDPALCPHTGTPVPGGLSWDRATYLLERIGESGRELIGFDLCEVAPNLSDPSDEWDLNVGARLLLLLCALADQS